MTIQKFTVGTSDTSIWAEAANLNYFLKTPLVPDAATGVVNKQSAVKAHSRRRYPGDPNPINVSSHQRSFMVDPGAKFSRGLPGKPFRVVGDPGMPGEEIRQFTFQGDWADVHAMFVADAKMLVQLYSGRGRYTVAAAGTP